ncbi:MAG: M91 family zinc metallopeptidase, partial [Firmicutes bacterium]|nr:M91 family zinc metallopeptidase [Bacillota bacterium]
FGGEYWDAHRGEYYLRARSFSPRLGRFTQPDPFLGIHNMRSSPNAIAQAGNLFVFTNNNPVRWIDPTGLFLICPNTHLPALIPWAPRGSTRTFLAISGTESDAEAVVSYLRMITNDILTTTPNRNGDRHYVHFTPTDATNLPIGTHLIRELINGINRRRVTIGVSDISNTIFILDPYNSSNPRRGSESAIRFNPNLIAYSYVDNWQGGPSTSIKRENHMALGHELIHAYRAARGIVAPEGVMIPHRFILPDGSIHSRPHPLEELLTIGIMYSFCPFAFEEIFLFTFPGVTENALRREQGLTRRISWY